VICWSCSSSLAGVSPVRVAVRRPGSRLAARVGNGPGRSPVSKALLGERLSGPQHEAKPAAPSLALPVRGDKREPSRSIHGEGHGRGEEPEIAAAKNPPTYGAWNVQIVTTGTGEALPGPVTCVFVNGEAGPITGQCREGDICAGWASEAAVVLLEPSGQHNRR
jgi:hypothetical protein